MYHLDELINVLPVIIKDQQVDNRNINPALLTHSVCSDIPTVLSIFSMEMDT